MAKPDVVVVTDSASYESDLESTLADEFDLTFCIIGEESYARFRKKIPELVIIDATVLDAKIFAFIDKVRNNPVTRNLPFVIVSRESTNEFVEKGVRSGVSHYVGVPFESRMLVEKVKFALKEGETSSRERYFSVNSVHEAQITTFGRISYISDSGIHFETHLKLAAGDSIHLASPLSVELKMPSIEVLVTGTSTDTFYNYPSAVDAEWKDPDVKKKVSQWILAHRDLNSPKKAKILFVSADLDFEEEILRVVNLSFYSVRFSKTLTKAIEDIPFMKPGSVVIRSKDWLLWGKSEQSKFLKIINDARIPWILAGDAVPPEPGWIKPFECPDAPSPIAKGVESVVTPLIPEPDRLYFSKHLEDSRLKLFFEAKTLSVGELGARLALSREIIPPCNFQLSLKIFTAQNLRNPYVRAWPPASRVSGSDGENGKYLFSVDCHFLGINDQQGQGIRQWLIDEQLKDNRKKIADITPTS